MNFRLWHYITEVENATLFHWCACLSDLLRPAAGHRVTPSVNTMCDGNSRPCHLQSCRLVLSLLTHVTKTSQNSFRCCFPNSVTGYRNVLHTVYFMNYISLLPTNLVQDFIWLLPHENGTEQALKHVRV